MTGHNGSFEVIRIYQAVNSDLMTSEWVCIDKSKQKIINCYYRRNDFCLIVILKSNLLYEFFHLSLNCCLLNIVKAIGNIFFNKYYFEITLIFKS